MDKHEKEASNTHRKILRDSHNFDKSLQDLTFGSAIDISAIEPSPSERKHATQAPDGGYGWVIVFTAFCNFCMVGGSLIGFSLLYPRIAESLDTNYGTTGWVGSLSMGVVHIPGFMYAVLVLKLGCRVTCVLGALLSSLGYILSSVAPNVYILYITYGFIAGCGNGMMYLSNVVIVQQYFDKKRGLAGGISMAGLSFGSITHAILYRYLLTWYNWRGTVLILAAVNLHAVVFGLLQRAPPTKHTQPIKDPKSASELYKPRPLLKTALENESCSKELQIKEVNKPLLQTKSQESQDVECTAEIHNNGSNTQRKDVHLRQTSLKSGLSKATEEESKTVCQWIDNMFDFSLLKNPQFLLYGITTMLMNVGMMCFYMHTPSRALHYGIPYSLIATLPPAIGICTLTSRVVFGFVSDLRCINRLVQYSIGIICGSIVELTFVFATTYPRIFIQCLFFGICNGIFLSVQSTVLVDLLTVSKIAKSQALLGIFIGISCLFVTPFAGFIYDVTQNYNIPYLVTGSVQFVSGLLLLGAFVVLRYRRQSNVPC